MSDKRDGKLELLTFGPPGADWTLLLAWIEDGDHSFKPRKQSSRTWEQNLDRAAEAVVDFVAAL